MPTDSAVGIETGISACAAVMIPPSYVDSQRFKSAPSAKLSALRVAVGRTAGGAGADLPVVARHTTDVVQQVPTPGIIYSTDNLTVEQ